MGEGRWDAPERRQKLAWVLLVELLSYQFASSVRWIETQDLFFEQYKSDRFIGVGPSPTLSVRRTRWTPRVPVPPRRRRHYRSLAITRTKVGALDDLECFKDIVSRDESHAWIALLECDVHTALAMAQPPPSFYHTVLQLPPSTTRRPAETIFTPPPAPLSGFSSCASLTNAINARYRDTIAALSECLGQHEW
jgi:hypothetical protein